MSEHPPESAPLQITAEQRADALERLNRPSFKPFGWVWEWTRSLLLAIGMFLFLHVFVMEAFKIPSGSMEDTLLVGDFLLVNKVLYGAEVPFTSARLPAIRQPRRGDVIVFKWPRDPRKNFVKRLMGLPGDTIAMEQGTVVRNGVRLQEQYVLRRPGDSDLGGDDFRWQSSHVVPNANAFGAYQPSRDNWGPIVVPPGNLFVLGDNRDNSLDSRYWGFVPDSMVRGTPLIVYYSYEPDLEATAPWITRIRWGRIGSRIH